LWDSNEIYWIENGTSSKARGIITMWRRNCFQLSRSFNGNNFSVIEGELKVGVGVQVTIVNVYCTGSLREKKLIWDDISVFRLSKLNRVSCGDYNSIRRKNERKSLISVSDYNSEVSSFSNL